MSNEAPNQNQAGRASAAQRIGRLIQRAMLMVAVVVGVVAAYWIWERVRSETFEVQVVAQVDPYGTLAGFSYDSTEQLLALMDLEVYVAGGSAALDKSPVPGEDSVWSFAVSGDERAIVRNMQLRGRLLWHGSDNDELTLNMPAPTLVDSIPNRFQLTLSPEAVLNYYENTEVTTEFALHLNGIPQPGLVHDGVSGMDLEAIDGGRYRLQTIVDLLLQEQLSGTDTLSVTVRPADDADTRSWAIAVPLRWFFDRPDGPGQQRIVRLVDGQTHVVCPRPRTLEPTEIRIDRWSGEMTVTGDNLDLVTAAELRQRDQRLACRIVAATETSLRLAIAGSPAPGTFELILRSESCESVAAGRIRVTRRIQPLRPVALDDPEVVRGQPVTVQWVPGSTTGQIIIETAEAGDNPRWQRRESVDARAGRSGPLVFADAPGSQSIRLRHAATDAILATWRVAVTPPPDITIVIRFLAREGGQLQDWPLETIWLDGRQLTASELVTPNQVKTTVPLGDVRWVAKGRFEPQRYTGVITVVPEHDFALGRDMEIIQIVREDAELRN